MAAETELKLRLSPATAARLAKHPLLAGIRPAPARRFVSRYFDTPALDLLERGVSLRLRKAGQTPLITVKSAAPMAAGLAQRLEWEGPAGADRFNWQVVDDPKLRRWLKTRQAQLRPVFTTDFLRRTWLLEPAPGVRIELALDRGQITSGKRRTPLLEIELELLGGRAADLFAVAQKLAADLPLHPMAAGKSQRGYALFTGTVAQPVKKGDLPAPSAQDGPVAAFRQLALHCLGQLQANETGAILGRDPECVHQARVAIRRLRAALSLFAPALPRTFVKRWKKPWRDLGRVLGLARDWDVMGEATLPALEKAFAGRREIRRLRLGTRRRRRESRRAVREALNDPAYSRLLLDFTAELLALKDRRRPLADFARPRLARLRGRVARLGCRAAQTDARTRHLLRITCKKLRYGADFFLPPSSGPKARRFHRTLGKVQTVLGDLNDLATAQTLIRDLLPDADTGWADPWLDARAKPLLRRLPAALKAFLRGHRPLGRAPSDSSPRCAP